MKIKMYALIQLISSFFQCFIFFMSATRDCVICTHDDSMRVESEFHKCGKIAETKRNHVGWNFLKCHDKYLGTSLAL